MVGHPLGLYPIAQCPELAQIFAIQRIRRPDGERNAMHHDGISLGDRVEKIQRPARRAPVVLAYDLEPIDLRPVLDDVRVVHSSKTETDAELGEVESVGHGSQLTAKECWVD